MPKRTQSLAQLSSAQRQLRLMQGEVANLSDPERFAGDLARLESQLAELEVAYEELELQNEELQATREALERQRHRYLHLFDEAPFGYLVTDLQGVVEEANRTAAAMIGVPQHLLPGKPLPLYLGPKSRAAFRQLLPKVCAGESMKDLEVRLAPREGEPIPVVLTVVRDLDDQKRTARLRWTIRDVSSAKAAQEALRAAEERLLHSQRLEAVGRLAGGVAHSFNNLLAAISFQCELLCDSIEERDPRRAHVEEIQHAGERAATLARQLLAYGRKQTLQPRVLHLSTVIREIEPMLRRLVGENIRVEARLDPAAGPVYVDMGQLEQVILNLAVNARDAMPKGGVLGLAIEPVELAAGSPGEPSSVELPPGSYVQLTVSDTGTGISPEALSHLFEPFFTTKERGKGTGLGLATVHGIVHQSGGQIRVESAPGEGSRFIILLPQTGESVEAVRPRPAGRPARRGSEVVLLVEDEDNIREPAIEILEARGYKVLSAADAVEALTVADAHRGPINILVTDVVMPGLSGSQLAGRLLARRPELRVLYISGYPEDSIAHHGVLSVEQNFLQKPFPPGQFLEKVREVLDTRVTV
jgi:two-component system cell cycle sensor histidine kinase/response regulator CckA